MSSSAVSEEPEVPGVEIPTAGVSPCQGAGSDPDPCAGGWAAGIEEELAWSLPLVARAFGHRAAAAVADLPGGPRGYLVMAAVSGGLPRSQLALAHRLGVDKTAMTYLLDELEAAGFIDRRPDPRDRRARHVVLTAAGAGTLRDYAARTQRAVDELLAPLTSEEAKTFREMLERVARAEQESSESCGADPETGCP